MLALAITILFTLTGLVAVAVIADNLLKARTAYVRLMREGEIMRAGFALQATAIDMSLRPAPRRVMAARRPTDLGLARQRRSLHACAAV